jgi:vancomycin permeability regulator SanA
LAYLLGLLLALLLAVVACFAVTYRVIDRRSAQEDLRRADVILVLGSAVWPNEQPSPSLRARTERAIELYQEGYAPRLLLSGGLGRYPPEESEVMRRLAADAGIPDEAMILDQQADSTRGSITTAKEIMDEQGWDTALIVSDPFHIERSLLMAEDAGFEAYGVPALQSPTYTVPARRGFYTAREVLALWYYLLQRPFT